MNSVKATDAAQVAKVHPNKKSFSDNIGLGYKTPVAAIEAVIAIVTHHKVNARRNGASHTISKVFALFTIRKVCNWPYFLRSSLIKQYLMIFFTQLLGELCRI